MSTNRLLRLHAGVYAVGHRAPRRKARWLAAVLACGEGALLSHRSAAALWGIRDREGPLPDVTVASRSGRRQPGIAVHRSGLAAADRSTCAGIPVTSPARTLVDLAPELEDGELLRAVREAQFRRIFALPAVEEALARHRCRRLAAIVEDLVFAETGLEDRLLEVCDRHSVPRPLTQQRLSGHRVDFLWPDERVIVETDGWQAHGTRVAFQADRSLSNRLQLHGYYVLRYTAADLRRRPRVVARQIRAALATGRRNRSARAGAT